MNTTTLTSEVTVDQTAAWPHSMNEYSSGTFAPEFGMEQSTTEAHEWGKDTRQFGQGSVQRVTTIASGPPVDVNVELVRSDCIAFGTPETVDPWQVFDTPFLEELSRARTAARAHETRITMLRAEGEQDEIILNPESERDFWEFVDANPLLHEAQLVLLDNGNLRAVWREAPDKHVGLQFLGRGMAQYVIFTQRSHRPKVSRVAGRDTLDALDKVISAYDLQDLLGT